MTLTVVPGPLPDDGDRLAVERDITRFIEGTQFSNFGVDNFDSTSELTFLVSQTDPPASGNRKLWFKRGEGVMYLWDDEFEKWVAMSNRKEMVVHLQSGAAFGSVCWIDHGFTQGVATEYHGKLVGTRMVLKVTATEPDASLTTRKHPIPPFLVCLTDVALSFQATGASGAGQGVYVPMVELGYCRSRVAALDSSVGPGHGILQNEPIAGAAGDAWLLSEDPYGYSNAYGAFVVGSGPPADNQTLLVFLRSTPASVGW